MKDNQLPKTLTVKVKPTLDSRFANNEDFINANAFMGQISDEIAPPVPPKCFQGAWYRKSVSSKDEWKGIQGVIKLGEFIPDEARFGTDNRIDANRYLDNPSIYMGGFAESESDAGLGLNISYTSGDTSYELDHGSPKIAYRPFWRYIYSDVEEENLNVTRRTINSWNVTDSRQLEHYYFPGDVIRMSVISPLNDYLQLVIEVIEPTTIEKYVAIRNSYGLKDNRPSDFHSPLFYSKGHGYKKAEFKRVNSIDQFGNEGFVVKPTKAQVTEAYWQEVYLYREIDGKLMKVPFNHERQCSMICPDENAFTVSSTNVKGELGGERITIHPEKANKNK